MAEHEHGGHRERMRERFLRVGLDGFAPHEALELLLMFAIPRRNVNPLAHRLLDHFGSLGAVLEATPEQLTQVPGIGEAAATLVAMVLPLQRAAEKSARQERAVLTNYREAKDYCRHLFAGIAGEVLYVICLDAQGRVLRAVDAIRGTIDEIPIYPRTVVEVALRHNAHTVVLAHNHPSGVREPSEADIQTTDTLREALAAVDIRLSDHIIYADGDCLSLAQWQQVQRILPVYTEGGQRKAADTKQKKRHPARTMQEKEDEQDHTTL